MISAGGFGVTGDGLCSSEGDKILKVTTKMIENITT